MKDETYQEKQITQQKKMSKRMNKHKWSISIKINSNNNQLTSNSDNFILILIKIKTHDKRRYGPMRIHTHYLWDYIIVQWKITWYYFEKVDPLL